MMRTLTRWRMQGGYIFTLTQLIFLDRVRVIWALQKHTGKFLIIVQTRHPFLSEMQKWPVARRDARFRLNTLFFQSIKRAILNMGIPAGCLEE